VEHWWAVIIVVIVSLAGSMTPIVVNTERYRFLLQCGTMFGAGTILATGFIHMLTGEYL
jgi:hypothetical protein